jgi:hypothetical protein
MTRDLVLCGIGVVGGGRTGRFHDFFTFFWKVRVGAGMGPVGGTRVDYRATNAGCDKIFFPVLLLFSFSSFFPVHPYVFFL